MSLDGSLALIFGGCCSNVYVLEAILKHEPDSGFLITVCQFLVITVVTLPSQLERRPIVISSPTLALNAQNFPPRSSSISGNTTTTLSDSSAPKTGWRLKPFLIPLPRLSGMAFMFFAVNMLNNWAFAFNISVPMHIILRSFGSVTTLTVGWLCGKKYSVLQVGSVAALTVGVVVSAWADASAKGANLSLAPSTSDSSTPTSLKTEDASYFLSGLMVLLAAQVLSAWMGIYTETTYQTYGRHWQQSLFYSHALGLVFSFFLLPKLITQFRSLILNTPPTSLPTSVSQYIKTSPETLISSPRLPVIPLMLLAGNAATQVACISGVNRLAAVTTAVTVTVVLNIRKLVSFLLSCWIFGNPVSGMMAVGAMVVFASGAIYGWDSGRRRGAMSSSSSSSSISSGGGGLANGEAKRNPFKRLSGLINSRERSSTVEGITRRDTKDYLMGEEFGRKGSATSGADSHSMGDGKVS